MTASIEVRVLNVGSDEGALRVKLCTADQWLRNDSSRRATVPAHVGMQSVIIPDVEPGTYAILVHHDVNADGTINRNFLGRPREGVGFSRDAPFVFGPPRFADVALSIADAPVFTDITLRFEPPAR